MNQENDFSKICDKIATDAVNKMSKYGHKGIVVFSIDRNGRNRINCMSILENEELTVVRACLDVAKQLTTIESSRDKEKKSISSKRIFNITDKVIHIGNYKRESI